MLTNLINRGMSLCMSVNASQNESIRQWEMSEERGEKDKWQNVKKEKWEWKDSESKSTINTNINHILLFIFFFFLFSCFSSPVLLSALRLDRRVLPGADILKRHGSPPKPCCPDISDDIEHVGNTLILTKTCGLNRRFCHGVFVLKQTCFFHKDMSGFEKYDIHIVLPFYSLYFLFSLFEQEDHTDISEESFFQHFFHNPVSNTTVLSLVSSVDFWDNWSSLQVIVCLSSSRGWCQHSPVKWAFMSACVVHNLPFLSVWYSLWLEV